jgi:hypothetical protein
VRPRSPARPGSRRHSGWCTRAWIRTPSRTST